MKRDPADAATEESKVNRRELLMQTAESLFASRGIDAVSLSRLKHKVKHIEDGVNEKNMMSHRRTVMFFLTV